MEIQESDRLLFMKYALPCAGTLVKRHSIRQEQWDALIETVGQGKAIPKDSEKIFKVAFAACSLIAADEGRKEINEDVIRQYYLFGHDKMIDKRYGEMGDFDPNECRIRPGKVIETQPGLAVVENSSGTKKYRTDYCHVSKGDTVVTHWNFVVEKIDEKTAEKMKVQKIGLNVR